MVLGKISGTMKEVLDFSQVSDIIRKALGTLYINISLTYILGVIAVESDLAVNRLLRFI